MTVNTETDRNLYDGTGAQFVFPYTFPVLQNADLEVRLVASDGSYTVAVLDTDYTMSGAGTDEGGEVEFILSAPSVGQQVLLIRLIDYLQPTDFKNQGRFFPRTHERSFDRAAMQAIRLARGLDYAIKVPDATEGFNATLPEPTADYVFVINPTGNGVTLVPASTFAALGEDFLQAGTGAQARTVQSKLRDTVSVKDFGAVGDGTTDDTAAFEAALAAARMVFVPGTTASYRVDNVSVPTGRTLYGEGVASKLTPFTVGAAYVLDLDASGSDVTIRDLWVDAPKATYPGKILVVASSPTRLRIEGCKISGGAGPVFLVSAVDCVVERCSVSGFVNSGITISATSLRNKVLNCTIDATGSTLNGILFGGNTGTVISGNTVKSSGVFGIFGDSSTSCIVSGNTVTETIREGINLNSCKNCTITGNTVHFLSSGSVSTDFGISLWGSGGTSLNNSITGNTVVNSFLSGIALAGDEGLQAYNIVSGNTIENCGRSNLADTAGVVVYGSSALDNLVCGNLIFDDAGVLKYGVFDDPVVGAPAGTIIRGNKVEGAATADVSRSATSVEAMNGRALRTWTPTITAASGTITTLGTVAGHYYEVEKMVFFTLSIAITTNGTGTGDVRASLPFTASAVPAIQAGRETMANGRQLSGFVDASSTIVRIAQYDNSYPGADGVVLRLSGWYERA